MKQGKDGITDVNANILRRNAF